MKRGFLKNVQKKKAPPSPPSAQPSPSGIKTKKVEAVVGATASSTTSADEEIDEEIDEEKMQELMSSLPMTPALEKLLEDMPPLFHTAGITIPDDYDSTDVFKVTEEAVSNPRSPKYLVAAIPSRRFRSPGESHSQWVFCRPTIEKVITAQGYPQPVPKPKFTEPSYAIKPTPNAGLGVFATRDIAMGELIVAERPLLVAPKSTYALHMLLDPVMRKNFPRALILRVALKEWDLLLKAAFDRMDAEDQEAYMQLANCHRDDGSGPLWGIMQTNSFSTNEELFDGENHECINTYCAVMKIGSRFNHSCMPNVGTKFSKISFSFQFTALIDIKAGEELCCLYIFENASVAERQASLALYGFVCHCPACEHATPETDALRTGYKARTTNYMRNLNWKGKGGPKESVIEPVAKLREALIKEGLAFTLEYMGTLMMLGNFYEGIGMKEKAKPFKEEFERYKLAKGIV